MRVTIQDIAKAVGVSAAAVSLALRNSPKISEQRKLEIRAAADRLGYAPNPAISALMANRSKRQEGLNAETIAWVAGTRESKSVTGETASRLGKIVLRGLNDEAASLGYRLEGFSLDECEDQGIDLHKVLVSRGIRGVILGPEQDVDRVLPLKLEFFSSIAFSNFHPKIDANRVMTNFYESAQMAINQMVGAGIERIALVCPKYVNTFFNYFLEAAFAMYLLRHKGSNIIEPVFYDKDSNTDWVKWYQENRPGGLICYEQAIPDLLRSEGVTVPDELSVILIADHAPESGGVIYASCGTNAYLSGRLAMSTLADDLSFNRMGLPVLQKWILVKPEWYGGTSIRSR